MDVFTDYAHYYNLLYANKDYAAETAFVLSQLGTCGQTLKTVLDLGCGTGRHALEFARSGIAVTGVDLSETMIMVGQEALKVMANKPKYAPVLLQGDACTVRLGQTFDAVVSLFHVLSYQNQERHALDFFATAKAHLKPGGLFFFDFWHGPGVLTDLPTRRERILTYGQTEIVRRAVPDHRVGDNVVVVNYEIGITNTDSGETDSINERHPLRYWFMPELRYLAACSDFHVLREGGWMHIDPPGMADWNAWMLLQA